MTRNRRYPYRPLPARPVGPSQGNRFIVTDVERVPLFGWGHGKILGYETRVGLVATGQVDLQELNDVFGKTVHLREATQ